MQRSYQRLRYRCSNTRQKQHSVDHPSNESEIPPGEVLYITRPYPLGPTVLVSLGLIILLLWTLFHVIPALRDATNIHTPLAYRSAKSDSHGFERTEMRMRNELQQEFVTGVQDYKRAQLQSYPELTAGVYLRGNVVNNYHWHKSCPVFSAKPHYGKKLQPTITVTRQQAEARRKVPCSYCCEIGKAT